MKKRALSLLLALVMVFGLLPVTARAWSSELDNGLTYVVQGDYVEITGYTGDATEVVIPEEIEGVPVTSIRDDAFYECDHLVSIVCPDSLTTIGDYAFFDCDNLTIIDFGDSLSNIGENAFYSCNCLTHIDFGDSPVSIGAYAFANCETLPSIAFRGELGSIGDYAFMYCYELASIDFGDGPTVIGSNAFKACSSLSSIDCGDRLTAIYSCAFDDCSNLTSVTCGNSLTLIGKEAFAGCTSLTSVDCGDSLTKILDEAFYYCTSLSSIDFGDNLTEIGIRAFKDCKSLTSIDLPDSVASINDEAFAYCKSLESIYFRGNAPVFNGLPFKYVQATAYYPANNPTWTDDVMKNYGSYPITWVAYNPDNSEPAENPFTDVPEDSFYYEPVLWALENGITTGATATTFDPDGKCLRAHVVTFLHRAEANPEPAAVHNPFTDVKSSDFFYKPVLWAVEKGITNGVSATRFGSYDVCNRAAVVTFLWRAAGSPEPTSTNNPFTDVKATDFFYKPVLWAIENGITNGISATEFGPTAACNRAQVVTFLYRAYN